MEAFLVVGIALFEWGLCAADVLSCASVGVFHRGVVHDFAAEALTRYGA